MSNLSEWWNALDTIHKIYWGLAIPFTLIFLIQMVLTFIGGEIEVDGDADFDVESDSGAGFQFFTLKNFIGFFTIFSWSGIASLDSGYSIATTLIVSTIAGLLMMTLMASLFYFFSKLTDSGTLNINNAKGAVAEVYMRIHGSRGNIGKVLVKVQGSLRELEAITDDPEDLPTGAVVNVKEVINDNILLVSKH
ncbi:MULTISPECIES: hypothetical protein [Roseivirga]|jgi:hypothetical protein|uniref:NfeD-like C-terminal domain-containing protein n=1 Tax=Roseivirga thermotolerans TaxID=1758176 RepID=A0ABQ3I4D7_9BACT|nr:MULTISPECIES: hypothetical protein [Roseivirga]MEC7753460.1 hypothetical protein [Bacteroidota bacterium]GHE62980.1 hypothetical protein GCM10011340_17870 [Roseivirga thermotolerans]|tara:strand:+ start:3278 stop:3856 length:579 start_codon:yes stop_codon:yes gene_type:complete